MNEPREMKHVLRFSTEVAEVFSAYIAAQGEVQNVVTDARADVRSRSGASYGYAYATLAAILEQTRPVLHSHGLALVQGADTATPGVVTIDTRLIHVSGQWMENSVTLHVDRTADAQSIGSAMSYARRYSVTALLSLATAEDDDDGVAASNARPSGRRPDPVSPFDDPNRDPALATRDEYEEVIEVAHGLSDAQRRELTAWREEQGIQIRISELTSEQAGLVMAKIEEVTSATSLEDLPDTYEE